MQLLDLHIEVDQPDAYYACGWYGKAFKSTDGGNTWGELITGLSSSLSLYGIYFINDQVGWVVGANGTVIKTTNGGGSTVSVLSPSKNGNIQIYPNPSEGSFYLNLPVDLSIEWLELWDTSGKKIKALPALSPIILDGINPGTYVLKVGTNKGVISKKIVIFKGN